MMAFIYIFATIGALVFLRALWHILSFPFKIHHDAWHKDQYYRPRGEKFSWNPFKGRRL